MEQAQNQIEAIDEDAPRENWIQKLIEDPETATLPKLLNAMSQLDDGVHSLSEEEMIQIGKMLVHKIDGYKHVEIEIKACIDELEARAQSYQQNLVNPIIEKISTLENGLNNLKNLMKFYMDKTGSYQLPGVFNSVKLVKVKGRSVDIKPGWENPDSKLHMRFPNLINRKYLYNKTAIKQALKDGVDGVDDFAELKDSLQLRWSVNKKPLKELESVNESESS